MTHTHNIIIVGGGLAGLVSSIVLSRAGYKVVLLEKKSYPYHKVCGEYVSNEVLPFLQSIGFDPFSHGATAISKLRISTPSGYNVYSPLDLGAFGLSRYTMDSALAKLAVNCGTELKEHTRATDLIFQEDHFIVNTASNEQFTAPFVIGSWGKRETLDKKLGRPFIEHQTRYMGVKYHLRTDYPADEIGLDNFDGGYSGISKIEEGKYNLCYFYRRPANQNAHGSIAEYQERVVFKNPVIRSLFQRSNFLFEEPLVINEINFEKKSAVENHILMCGDTAGLITPLCGNGMSMAITAAKLLSELLLSSGLLNKSVINTTERGLLEQQYQELWNSRFRLRLAVGRTIQSLFGTPVLTEIAIKTVHAIPPIERKLINLTHGKVI